jgi:hypothetical protein
MDQAPRLDDSSAATDAELLGISPLTVPGSRDRCDPANSVSARYALAVDHATPREPSLASCVRAKSDSTVDAADLSEGITPLNFRLPPFFGGLDCIPGVVPVDCDGGLPLMRENMSTGVWLGEIPGASSEVRAESGAWLGEIPVSGTLPSVPVPGGAKRSSQI